MQHMLRRLVLISAIAIGLSGVLSRPPVPALAAGTVAVTNVLDEASSSCPGFNGQTTTPYLRCALLWASSTASNAPNVITFDLSGVTPPAGGVDTIGLLRPLPYPAGHTVTVQGPGVTLLDISGRSQNRILENQGTLTLSGVTLLNGSGSGASLPNSADGGAIWNSGTLTLTGVAVERNAATNGGGIYDQGNLTIAQSTLEGNRASGSSSLGGALLATAASNVAGTSSQIPSVTITDSVFQSLPASQAAGVTPNQAGLGGAIAITGGTLSMTTSTITGAVATAASNAGEAIYAADMGGPSGSVNIPPTGTNVSLVRSTLGANGGTSEPLNYAIMLRTQHATRNPTAVSLSLDSSTISGNGRGIQTSNGSGGTTPITAKNTILAGNPLSYGSPLDLDIATGATLTTDGNNIFGTMAGLPSGFVYAPTDQTNVSDPKLGSPASNGGPTPTMAETSGSPAIDQGTCYSISSALVLLDQRGFVRPQGGACDVGAYELNDTVAPSVSITGHPAAISNIANPTFTFSGSDNFTSAADLKYTCTLDSSSTACSSPHGTGTLADGPHTFKVEVRDEVGNVASDSWAWTNDTTAPTLTGAPQGTPAYTDPNGGEWFSGPVAVHWTCSDNSGGSGINGACPSDSTISGEGQNLTSAAWVQDKAGNVTNATSSPAINIDSTPPLTTFTPPGSWSGTSAAIALSASDNLSGVANTYYKLDGGSQQTYSSAISVSGAGQHVLQYWSVDNAGNQEHPTTLTFTLGSGGTGTLAITHTQNPGPNSNGWNRTAVNVQFICTAATSCTGSGAVNTEGENSVIGTASDGTNTLNDTAQVNIDLTNPAISGSKDRGPNSYGWYNAPVTVSFSCSDPAPSNSGTQSGIASCPVATTLTGDGAGQSVNGMTADNAGNTATTPVGGINIDTIPPIITPSYKTSDGSVYAPGTWTNLPVTVTFACADSGSGPDTSTITSPVTLSAEGKDQSTTGGCTDKAGNTSTVSVSGIDIDSTAPVISGTPTTDPAGSDGSTGWYNGPVSVAWNCTDGTSSNPADGASVTKSGLLGACPANTTITGEGAGLTSSASISDRAGNVTTATTDPINIDHTPPTTQITAPDGWNTWTNNNVVLGLNASDNLSGAASTYYTLDGGSPQTYDPTAKISITTEGIHLLTFWSVDYATNAEATHTVQIKVDKTAPSISHAISPAPNGNGWNQGTVSVTFTCNDSLSGIASCDDATPPAPTGTYSGRTGVSAEGITSVTGTAQDVAGNQSTDAATVQIDKTRPNITGSTDRAANSNGWYNAPVAVSFSCSDPIPGNSGAQSGIASCPATAPLVTNGAGQSVSGTATDAAGNSSSTTVSGINIDMTPPAISATVTSGGAPYTPGHWTNHSVMVAFHCTDALSGVPADPTPTTLSSDGVSQSVSGTCTDLAGNSAGMTMSGINIDSTKPTISASADRPSNTNGWYRAPVLASFACGDALSGVASCSPATYLSSEGTGLSAPGSVTDVAGNSNSTTLSNINIDETPPTVSPSVPSSPIVLNTASSSVTLAPGASDTLSGLTGTPTCGSLTLNAVGSYAVTCSATDKAGNTGSGSATYQVAYGDHFTYNTTAASKAGSKVGITLQLVDAAGKNYSASSVPVTAIGAANSAKSQTTTLNAGFSYSKSQYSYTLSTSGMSAGSYFLMFRASGDPTIHYAPFVLK